MKRFAFVLILVLCAGCAFKKADTQKILKIFKNHGYAAFEEIQFKKVLSSKGIEGLKRFDRNIKIIRAGKIKKESGPKRKSSAPFIIEKNKGNIYVKKTFRYSPAFKAGLKNGDKLIEINGLKAAEIKDFQLSKAILNSEIKITYRRSGELSSQKAIIKGIEFSPAVWGFMEKSGIGYLRIVSFMPKSSIFFYKELSRLKKRGARKIIVDVRANYGGSFNETAKILDLLTPKGKLLFQIKSRHKGYRADFYSKHLPSFNNLKFAVLVDGKTASKAEIFAQAMKELLGASIIGEKTASNTAITKIFKLDDGKGLRITIAKMFPLSGTDLELKGVALDIKTASNIKTASPAFYISPVLNDDRSFERAVQFFERR